MNAREFVIDTEPTPNDVQYLEDRLYEFNTSVTGITDGAYLAIFVRDEQNRIVAGICGNTWGECCEIRQFWVEESRRKQGLGTELFEAAEQEARRRGCTRRGRHPHWLDQYLLRQTRCRARRQASLRSSRRRE